MRRLLTAFLLVASTSLAHAGVLVEFTDGTKLTVESHWNDGQQVHLVRGGVDMIMPKSRIKSMNEDVPDPEVYRSEGDDQATAKAEGATQEAPAPAAAAPDAPAKADASLAAMSPEELQELQRQEAEHLLDAQNERFNAFYGGNATSDQQKRADEALVKQSHRTTEVRAALQKANKTDTGVPTVPAVEQPQ